MSKINFRNFADQIYGLLNKKYEEFFEPQLIKNNFITKFKEGNLILNNIKFKENKQININEQLCVNQIDINELNLLIPDENSIFECLIDNFKIEIKLNELKENDFSKIIINKILNFYQTFETYAIDLIEKKEKKTSFLDGLINNLFQRIIQGMKIEIKNFLICIKYEENISINFEINSIKYDEINGIIINKINLTMNENDKKFNLIKDLDININIKYINEENDNNIINLEILNFNMQYNTNIINNLLKIFNIINNNNYKQIEYKYKNLIQYNKQNLNEKSDKSTYYKNKWKYIITTLIKLRKYKLFNRESIFFLNYQNEQKIIMNYLEKNIIDDNIILCNEYNIIKNSKKIIEKKVLENKKKSIGNPFAFFFGGGAKKNDNNELNEEEKKILENIFIEENLLNFMNGKNKKNDNDNFIIQKFFDFIKKIIIKINIPKIQINITDELFGEDIYLIFLNLDFSLKFIQKFINCNFYFGDLETNFNESIFLEKIDNKKYSFEISIDEQFKTNINLNFNNFLLDERLLSFFVCFIYSFKNRINIKKVFKLPDYNNILKKEENINNILEYINKININIIPSLSIKNEENILSFHLKDINKENNIIKFKFKLNDKKYDIIPEYLFAVEKQLNNLFKINISEPFNLIIPLSLMQFLFNIIIKLFKKFTIIEKQSSNQNLILFFFEYQSNLNLKNFGLDIKFNKIFIKIQELYCTSFLTLNELSFKFINYELDFSLQKICFNTNRESTILVSLVEYITSTESENKIEKTIRLNNKIDSNIDIKKINIFIDIIEINFVDGNFITKILTNKIKGEKKENNLELIFSNLNLDLYLNNNNNILEKNIVNFNNEFFVIFDMEKSILNINLENPELFLDLPTIVQLKHSFLFILNAIDLEEVLIKFNIIIKKTNIKFEEFNILFETIKLKNFEGNNTETVFINLININLMNNNFKILDEEKIELKIISKSKIENDILIDVNSLLINLTQNDIYKLIIGLEKKDLEMINEIKEFEYSLEFNKSLFFQNNINLNIKEKKKLKNQNNILLLNSNLKELKLNLLLDKDNIHLAEFGVENIFFDYNFLKFKDINKNIKEFEKVKGKNNGFELKIKKISLKYLDINSKEITVFSEIPLNNLNKLESKNLKSLENDMQITISLYHKKFSAEIKNTIMYCRIDSFLSLYYYFKKAIPTDFILSSVKQQKNSYSLSFDIKFINFQIILQTSFHKNENLLLYSNEIILVFSKYDKKQLSFPYGQYKAIINKININLIANEKNIRNLLSCQSNFFILSFLLENDDIKEITIYLGSILINLSYIDILFFLKAYHINIIYLFQNDTRLESDFIYKENKKQMERLLKNKINSSDKNLINLKPNKNKLNKLMNLIVLKNINLTLIDNSRNNYYPFMKFDIENCEIIFKNKNDYIHTYFDFDLFSYNYICSVWEPTIEKSNIHIYYEKTKMDINDIDIDKKLTIYIKEFPINISDMSMSFALSALNNWLNNYIKEKNKFYKLFKENNYNLEKYEDDKENSNNLENLKISNNKIINKTGDIINFKYFNENLEIKPNESINLNYFIENQNNKITKNIEIKNGKDVFEKINIEKIGLRKIDYEKYYYLIDSFLSKERIININIYSPIIFKNKTNIVLNLVLGNSINEKHFIKLLSNETYGIPNKYYQNSDSFFYFLDENQNTNENTKVFFFDNINNIDNNNIIINDKFINLKIKNNIEHLKQINIFYNYSIINCLPFPIAIKINSSVYNIEKCNIFYFDFVKNMKEFSFSISINNEIFLTSNKNWFNENKKNEKYIKFFKKNDKDNYFYLSYNLRQSNFKNQLIIYVESIIYNLSGNNNLKIISYNEENKTKWIYPVQNNLFLMSSNINIDKSKIIFKYNSFDKKEIDLKDLIAKSNFNFKIKFNDNKNKSTTFIIKSKFSNIGIFNYPKFRENIKTNIFKIYSECRVINLFKDKIFYIGKYKENSDDQNFQKFLPNSINYFNFFDCKKDEPLIFGIGNINNSAPLDWTNKFIISNGIYTFCLNNIFFNVEIRLEADTDIIEIIVEESNIKNAKYVIYNCYSEEIQIFQKNNDILEKQVVKPKEKKILIMNDYNIDKLNFDIIVGNEVNNFSFNLSDEDGKLFENKTITLHIQENKFKKYLSVYDSLQFKQFKKIKNEMNININFENIYLALIGDNERNNKKLINYKRNEILYIFVKNLIFSKISNFNNLNYKKEKIIYDIEIECIDLYNQISDYGKFYNVITKENKKDKFIFKSNFQIDLFKNDRFAIINSLKFEFSKLRIYIDPNFVYFLFEFYGNIIYRMNLNNYNVDEIFLNKNDLLKENLIENYSKPELLYNGENIHIPILNIIYKLSDVDLSKLLKKKLQYSSFYVWVIRGLAGKKHTLNIEKSNVKKFIGNFSSLIIKILDKYSENAVNQITKIAVKGIFNNIKKYVTLKKKEKKSKNIEKDRIRISRMFYGKYQFFKNYNKEDALNSKNAKICFSDFLGKDYYIENILREDKNYFLFTQNRFIIFNINKFEPDFNEFYNNIDKIEGKKENVLMIKTKSNNLNPFLITFTDKKNFNYIYKNLNEELNKNLDDFNNI